MNLKAQFAKISDLFLLSNPTGHFWYQRVTAVALIPLTVWLLVLLDKALAAPYAETLDWLTFPVNAAAIMAWTVAVVYHAALGVQVVIEDYVSTLPVRHAAIRMTNSVFLLLGGAALAALFFILFAR